MPYKITDLSRLDPPNEMMKGMARWRAIVDFWIDGDENNKITEEIIMDRTTQSMINLGNDDWVLSSKEDTLKSELKNLIEKHEPSYLSRIANGEKGYKGSEDSSIHGIKRNSDDIIASNKISKILNIEFNKKK